MFKENLKNPPKKYRPAPFWSWNEKLDTEETRLQVRQMNEAGIGGYFMHARGGLQTEYMGDEWMDNVLAATNEGDELGMQPWGYDENGWPSGFGSGAVNGLGVKYQQKYLRCKETETAENTDTTITNIEYEGKNLHFYYDINPFYVDTLDDEVTREFLKSTHEQYLEKMGKDFNKMKGFFTDEPQISRSGIPWSFIMEREYKSAYGEELLPLLPALFYDTENCSEVRYNFYKLITRLFSQNFFKVIKDWCNERGSALTGHLVIEEGYGAHIYANGTCMPQYEYFDIPGMDHLGRRMPSIQADHQLTSVANQLGKKQILTESFALCGWNVSFEDLRWIYESQMVRGVNWLCQHLEGYSLRGIRKRDYPASLFKHQPWWKEYRTFNDAMSRIGMLIAEGEVKTKVLVLHTVESGWVNMRQGNGAAVEEFCQKQNAVMSTLEANQINFHLGDGIIMERHGSVENNGLKIGNMTYSAVIVPPSSCFSSNTFNLLKEFKEQGGTVIFAESVPTLIDGKENDGFKILAGNCPVVDIADIPAFIPDGLHNIKLSYMADHNENPIIVTMRRFEEQKMTMHYLYNPCDMEHKIGATVKGGSAALFNAFTGEEERLVYIKRDNQLNIDLTLPARGSAVIFVYDDENAFEPKQAEKTEKQDITSLLRGEWQIKGATDNSITLDTCDVYFDGELYQKNCPITSVQEKACEFGRRVKTELIFRFNVRKLAFKKCQLVLETPEIFTVKVNGREIDKKIVDTFHDTAFKCVDIYGALLAGYNEISLTCDFEQSERVYENIKKSLAFESEKNKLFYDMEIEAIYLRGDFGVYTDSEFVPLDKRAFRVDGGFYLAEKNLTVTDGAICTQGYPFFAGEMTFSKKVTLTEEQIKNAVISFAKLSSNVTKVKINGVDAGTVMWRPYDIDVSQLLKTGENEIEITVIGNLRNLLGPFHLEQGECYGVCPSHFFETSKIWRWGSNKEWNNGYCFVEFGLFF